MFGVLVPRVIVPVVFGFSFGMCGIEYVCVFRR